MSCLGLDLGNEHSRIAIARQGGVDVFLDEESSRETPSVISFTQRDRCIGASGAASALGNLKNTVWQIKRIIGRKFRDPELQSDLKLMPCLVTEGRGGWPAIHVSYLGEHRIFGATELLGMVLAHLKSIAAKNMMGVAPGECVIGTPAFMDDVQRRAYVDAAAIAGLRPLKLIHETTAAAISYGLYRTDLLHETREIFVAFVDVGHAHTQVAVVALRRGVLRVLSYAFDRCLGGRDFDEVLFSHFAAKFSATYRIDVLSNSRACQRLRRACEKLKKILSANAEAPISIECLMDEKDVKGFITREEFEKLCAPLLQRIRHACERALTDSELAVDDISAVEVIGSGSRVPAIARVLAAAFRREPSRTLNASESIARGCALQGAMFSPTFRVKKLEVHDYFLFPVAFSWAGPAAFEYGLDDPTTPSASIVPQILPNSIVFRRGVSFPTSKQLTFWVTNPIFEIRVLYGDLTELSASASNPFATFTVGPLSCRKPESSRLRLSIHLNQHGILMLSSATLMEDEELESGMQQGQSRMRRLRHTDVPIVEMTTKELSSLELQNAIEKEFEMEFQDRVSEETKEAKNALEALVYDMRNKFYGKLQEYASETEKKDLLKKLQDTETWLYEGGDNETKTVYAAKLADLKMLVKSLEERVAEEHARDAAMSDMQRHIENVRNAAIARGAHLDQFRIERASDCFVFSECDQAELWLREAKHSQAILPKYAKPAVWASDIKHKAELLDRYCKSLIG
ncbi:hypothetical protein SELMODRAFT_440676 [Selaginella moellendorffii]|uniref:EF-hand domain-containing protein n=1 Tax=Selaginella moellendorffii TaxID=88036 RepID=D8RDG8_SELML|nr:hypothetical protein SELMODRAFT_440676 [Selaginella moellendorffii]